MKYAAIVMGVSSGGMNAMQQIFTTLPVGFELPVILVQHLSPQSDNHWVSMLNKMSHITIKEADEKEKIKPGHVYVAPANYHLLIEKDGSFSLTIDERVNFARPSIDVMFESAAFAYGNSLIGVVLTGANHDGAAGLQKIKELGGLTIVQDPEDAESSFMPLSAIKLVNPDHILTLERLIQLLVQLDNQNKPSH